MRKAIYFDMDGTIANLYGVENWLPMLENRDSTPYKEAKPLIRLNVLARKLNELQRKGYKIGIVSWLAKNGTREYNKRVIIEKINWLHTHLRSVMWNEIHIVEYGTPKQNIVEYPHGILFDDEQKNRIDWIGQAHDETNIMGVLKAIS